MSLDHELTAYLDRTTPSGLCKARNIGIVKHYYGFGDQAWPTLETTAETFGLGTRERVRQILNTAFRERVRPRDLPKLRAAAQALGSQPFWVWDEFLSRIGETGRSAPRPSPRGLLSLMHDLELAPGHDLHDHDLERLTRSHFVPGAAHVIAQVEIVPTLKAALHGARKVSCRLGLANTALLDAIVPAPATPDMIKAVLKIDPNCWTSRDEGEFWYAAESRDNALVGLAAKVFAVTSDLSPRRLAETLANALRARSSRRPRPSVNEIEAWIRGSKCFSHTADRVAFLDRPGELTRVEQELVSYLSACERSDYKALKAHLEARGVVSSLIPKAATLSPLVHVDRSGGAKAYRYSLIGRE